MSARLIIEAETPKDFFKRLPRKPGFDVGDEVCRATGDTRDIIGACLDALKELDREKFFAEIDGYSLAEYLRGETDLPRETDPEWYLFEHLFNVLQQWCPPFTFFGYFEADGSVGCWPLADMDMEEAADMDKLTIVSNPEEMATARTRYILVDTGHKELWDTVPVRRLVWKW